MTKDLHIDHEAMARVVQAMDRLIAELGNKGTSGSYASMQGAAHVAQAVKSVAEQEMGLFLTQYNAGFGAAARDYQTLANTVVTVRNKVAATANLHAANDGAQAKAFAPLQGGESLTVSHGHATVTPAPSYGSPTTTTTTTSPGAPLTSGPQRS